MTGTAVATILLYCLVLTSLTLATPLPAHAEQQIYGCQRYASDVTHCDLMLSEMQGYEVAGNSTLIHPLSSEETIFVEGRSGKAAEIRAEYRESIEIMNAPDLNPSEFTIAFWMKPTVNEPYSHIVSHSNKAQNAGWVFDVFASGNATGAAGSSIRFGVFNSNGTIFSPDEIPLKNEDGFVHLAGTFDGATIRLYKDGSEAGSARLTGNYTSDPGVPIRIGSGAYCSSCNRWSGVIDDLRMYDRALSRQEIANLYEVSNISESLVGHWKFDGDTSDSLGKHEGTSTTMLTSMAFLPDGRLLFSEKNTGAVRIMSPEFELYDDPFASVPDAYASWEQGMLGLAVDPDFEANHFVYLYYSALVKTEDGSADRVVNRVVRFTENDNKGQDMTILLDNIPASRGYHSGGALAFGPDGKLYITVGDATEHIFAQDPSIAIGKVLRLNKDGSVPADNPYLGLPVYTIGHRNMYGIAFDSDGTGMITENGDFHYDELNILVKGGNYGFPSLQPPNLAPERSNNSSIKPVRTYWDAIAPTQMIFYQGDAIPELKGLFLFGSFTGDIYAVGLSDNKTSVEAEYKVELGHFPFVPTVAIAQSPDGKIYYGGYQIYRLDSISEPRQNLFQVIADVPDTAEISDLQLEPENNKMTLDLTLGEGTSRDADLTVKIPKGLIDRISAVNLEGQAGGQQESKLDFSVDDTGEDYDVLRISLAGSQAAGSLKIAIIGTSVIPEFQTSSSLMVVAGAISAVTSMIILSRRLARN